MPHNHWPTIWRKSAERVRKQTPIAGALSVFFTLACLVMVMSRDYFTAAMSALMAVLFTALVLSLNTIWNPSPHGGANKFRSMATLDGDQVTFIGNNSKAQQISLILNTTASAILILTPFLAEASKDQERSFAVSKFAPVLPVFALFFLAPLASRLVRKRAELGLGMSPRGVYYWTWFGCCFFEWESIGGVHPTSRRSLAVELIVSEVTEMRPVVPEENWVGRLPSFRRRRERIHVGVLDADPLVVYRALQFFQAHPEHRGELGTDDAVRRIEGRSFEAEPDSA